MSIDEQNELNPPPVDGADAPDDVPGDAPDDVPGDATTDATTDVTTDATTDATDDVADDRTRGQRVRDLLASDRLPFVNRQFLIVVGVAMVLGAAAGLINTYVVPPEV
ncbi:MAG TPA: hypothetical protein DEG13_00830, partial [Candidatus Microthrix parvicella]|nr:hypothetical protein [Candidatus Microthrix parvicella]